MGAALVVLIVLLVWVFLRLAPIFGTPHLIRLGRFHSSLAADRGRVVVCFGDSLTQGNASFDYVYALASRLEPDGYTLLNAGVNGDLAWNVLQRIDAVLRGQPAFVVLLVGTNDARACESDWAAARYVTSKKLPRMPDEAFFEESYRGLLEALSASECTRTITVTIPPLGERAGERIDEIVARLNRIILRESDARELACHGIDPCCADPGFNRREFGFISVAQREGLHQSFACNLLWVLSLVSSRKASAAIQRAARESSRAISLAV